MANMINEMENTNDFVLDDEIQVIGTCQNFVGMGMLFNPPNEEYVRQFCAYWNYESGEIVPLDFEPLF